VSTAPRVLLVVDTSVLVNLAHLDRFDLFAATGFEAHVPNHVIAEVTREDLRDRVAAALATGHLTELEITESVELLAYGDLKRRRQFGDGECAAMAVAFTRDWAVAIDEAGPVRRLVLERLGSDLLVTTPSLLRLACLRNVISRSDLSLIVTKLEANRFRMPKLEVDEE